MGPVQLALHQVGVQQTQLAQDLLNHAGMAARNQTFPAT
jgi:hypothetical protein